jgi:hypothetical protein
MMQKAALSFWQCSESTYLCLWSIFSSIFCADVFWCLNIQKSGRHRLCCIQFDRDTSLPDALTYASKVLRAFAWFLSLIFGL